MHNIVKRFLLILCIVSLSVLGVKGQDGFVTTYCNDSETSSSYSIGQIFTRGLADSGYDNEGLQQSFLYRTDDTLLYEKSSYPVLYRPAIRRPGHASDYLVNLNRTMGIYLLPTRGVDTLVNVMSYGVTFVNDTTAVAPNNVFTIPLALYSPTLWPAGVTPTVQYFNNAPAEYAVGLTTPVRWTYSIANRVLIDTQLVTIQYLPCGRDQGVYAVDFEQNEYDAVRIGPFCWTKQNLKSAYYADGVQVSHPMMYNNSIANYNTYGYLYTWNDALRCADTATLSGSSVQGVCPDGWRMPRLDEVQYLAAFTAPALRTTTGWLTNDGTNTTGYSALPAGLFTGTRYENLLGETGFWTSDRTSATTSEALSITNFCSELLYRSFTHNTGLSVRCLKN